MGSTLLSYSHLIALQIFANRKDPEWSETLCYSLLSQVVRVSDDIIAFRRWVASSSLTPFSESDVDKSSEANNTSAGTNSNPLNGSNSGKQPCVPENNDDQALSDDPRLPNQITPTPSRDVLPRELPSKVFGGKKSSSSADQATTTTTVDGGAAKDNDNMSGVSTTTTSSSSSSASSHTDTVGPSFLSKKRKPFWLKTRDDDEPKQNPDFFPEITFFLL